MVRGRTFYCSYTSEYWIILYTTFAIAVHDSNTNINTHHPGVTPGSCAAAEPMRAAAARSAQSLPLIDTIYIAACSVYKLGQTEGEEGIRDNNEKNKKKNGRRGEGHES